MCVIAQIWTMVNVNLHGTDRNDNHNFQEHIMGLLSFVKEAGQKLFQTGSSGAAATAGAAGTGAAAAAPAPTQADVATLNETAGKAILKYIQTQNLPAENLSVSFDGASGTAIIKGQAKDQPTREKIVLCAGNIQSVAHVNDQMTVAAPSTEAKYYTVENGDTLSKISKEMYGDANKYNLIFEANKPMLTSPDKIYPGQMLRIPAQD
jgi:nucleoid-associated protein YgaU